MEWQVTFESVPQSNGKGLVARQSERSRLRVATRVEIVYRPNLGVQFHAFPLDPGIEPSGVLYQERMRKRYGCLVVRSWLTVI